MKQILIAIITLSTLSFAFTANDSIISAAKTLQVSSDPLTWAAEKLAENEKISFSTSEIPSTDIIDIETSPSNPLAFSATFSTAGKYNIFISASGSEHTTDTKQTVQQIVTEEITASVISKCEAANPKQNTKVSVKFAFAAETIYKEDHIILSISSGDEPSNVKNEITLTDIEFDSAEISKEVTFTEGGTYNVWIKRGVTNTKQTDISIVVAATETAEIITSSKPLYKNIAAGVNLVFSSGVEIGDIISFSASTPPDEKVSFTVAQTSSPLTNQVTFDAAGIYDIYIRSIGEALDVAVKQNTQQIVFEKVIDDKIITKVEATKAKLNTQTSVKFTFVSKTLYNGDELIFSLSSTNDISNDLADSQKITLSGVDFTKNVHSQSVTFTKKGIYNLWIRRDSKNTK